MRFVCAKCLNEAKLSISNPLSMTVDDFNLRYVIHCANHDGPLATAVPIKVINDGRIIAIIVSLDPVPDDAVYQGYRTFPPMELLAPTPWYDNPKTWNT